MNTTFFAKEACRSYTDRDGRAGTMEFITAQYNDGTLYTLRGTAKNKGRFGWLARMRDIANDALIAVPCSHTDLGCMPLGVRTGADDIIAHIAKAHSMRTPLYFSGHSLGGAVASAVADILYRRGYNVQGLVTFNAPRSGALQYFAGPADIIRHAGDVVSCMPPYWNPSATQRTVGIRTWRGNHSMKRLLGVLEDH